MKKIIFCTLVLLLLTACKKHPLFLKPGEIIVWGAVDTVTYGGQIALGNSYDDSLQRYYFTIYTAITNFKTKEFRYHVSSVNFHKDSVNIGKLHRLEKYNGGEKWMVKRKKNGNYVITSEWVDEEKHKVKIKTGRSNNHWALSPGGEATAFSNGSIVNGHMRYNVLPGKQATHVLQNRYYDYLLRPQDNYLEYIFEFDTVTYMLHGQHYPGSQTNFRLYKISNKHMYSRQVNGFKADLKPAPDSLKINTNYHLIITVSLPNGDTLKSELPTVNQEIRWGKYGTWVGFSTCTWIQSKGTNGTARNPKKGCLKMLIL